MEDFHILLYTLLYYFKFIDDVIYLCNFFYLCNFLTCQKKEDKRSLQPCLDPRESPSSLKVICLQQMQETATITL